MQGKVEICGVNTSKLAVLDSATTRRLLLRVRQGDKSAREELIAGNLRLVLSVIQRFSSRGENIDDLFQVGCIGLIKAIDNFDAEAHDVRFSTYGVPMIAGEIRRYLRDNSALRVSRSVRDTAYKILQAREKLTAETGKCLRGSRRARRRPCAHCGCAVYKPHHCPRTAGHCKMQRKRCSGDHQSNEFYGD